MSRLAILMSLLLVPSMASAKDLRKRVGVGYQNQLSEIPSISVKVGLQIDGKLGAFQQRQVLVPAMHA